MGNKKFARRTGKGMDGARGLCIGRQVDAALNRHVSGEEPYCAGNTRHDRLGHIVRALRARKIVLLRAQVAVARPDLGIRTTIDAVGVCTSTRELVVVELKTTQHASGPHRDLYDEACLNRPVLANGWANTERNLHRLQAGFGVIACRRITARPVTAVVVVSYRDSAVVHRVPESACNAALFKGGLAAPTGTRPQRHRRDHGPARFDAWPSEDERVAALLRQRGIVAVQARGSRNAVECQGKAGSAVAVAGCVRGRWSRVKRSPRKDLLRLLLKTHTDVYGNCAGTPQTFVLSPHGRSWRLHRVDPST